MNYPNIRLENKLVRNGYHKIIGIDEAGRGALAGPVVAAAYLFNKKIKIPKSIKKFIKDSKLLTGKQRFLVYKFLIQNFIYSIGIIDHRQIDKIGILSATHRAMTHAVTSLRIIPQYILTDGGKFYFDKPYKNITDGDRKVFSISAASIIAKVTRDELLLKYDLLYPEYGFRFHKGYGTKKHYDALKKFGMCPLHRVSFRLF